MKPHWAHRQPDNFPAVVLHMPKEGDAQPSVVMLILAHLSDAVNKDSVIGKLCLTHEALKCDVWLNWLGCPALQEQHRHNGCKACQNMTSLQDISWAFTAIQTI